MRVFSHTAPNQYESCSVVIVAIRQPVVTASPLSADKRAMCLVFSRTRNYNKPNRNYRGETFPPNGGQQPMETFKGQLDRARRGEPEALSALYRQLLPAVFGYIAARVPDRATAEDLTSDVFVQMVESVSRLRASDEAGVAAWLLKIARMTVAGYYRKRERQPAFVSLEPTFWEEEPARENPLIHASHPDLDPVRRAEARDEWATVV